MINLQTFENNENIDPNIKTLPTSSSESNLDTSESRGNEIQQDLENNKKNRSYRGNS